MWGGANRSAWGGPQGYADSGAVGSPGAPPTCRGGAAPAVEVVAAVVSASSPWMNTREHRGRRGAGLARRLERRMAALLLVREATKSGAQKTR